MGSLSNLYISQSYQSLIHLATNNTASANLIGLQDGLGNSIGVSVNTGGNLFLSGSLTASLLQGYTLVGDATNRTALVSTSSFGGALPAGTISSSAQITGLGFVSSSVTASSLITASFSGNTLTFTKGDSSTFGVVIPDISGSTIPAGTISGSSQITALGFVSSSITASSLVTASVSLNTITFTKGDASTFNIIVNTGSAITTDITSLNSFTQSQETKDTTLASVTSSLNSATASLFTSASLALVTASFDNATRNLTFTKGDTNQFSVNIPDVSGSTINTGSFVTTSSFNSYTSSNDQRVNSLETNSASVNISITNLNSFTSSNSNTSLNAYTQSNDTKWTTLGALTGSYATTGSNLFTGIQTYRDAALNATSLVSTSGSIMLVAKSYTSASAHITGSTGNLVNFIFKDNNNTSDTVLSGSNNIFGNPVAPTAGFKRFASNGNIALYGALPQISSSMAFPISMNGNFLQTNTNNITLRGPVSASAWTIAANFVPGTINIGVSAASNAEKLLSGLTISANYIQGGLNLIANQSALTGSANTFSQNFLAGTAQLELSSSALNFTNNIINDAGFILRNQFYNGTPGLGVVQFLRNNIAGTTETVIISGSQPAGTTNQPFYNDNAMFGGANIIYGDVANARTSGTTAYHSATRNIMMGNSLILSASSAANDPNSFGSVFAGRWNAIDGRREKTSDNIFVVGTGTSTVRKTGFLIDSGSNTFVEGTLNVSGSTKLTGSLSIQSGSALPSATGSSVLTWNATTGQVGQSPIATLISSSFSVGAFNSTVTQSGSSGVSQSMTYNNTDISNGITLNGGGTQLTIANSGTYNIQFSAQLNAPTGADTIWIWLKKNGTNVSNTGTKLVLANNEANVAAWNFVVPATASDYFELVWQNNGGHAQLLTEAGAGNYPAIPSIIVTVTQVE
jgi:hypothetical protein